jgi:hypothetical protein
VSGSSPSRDLAKARTSLGGTWDPPGAPSMPSWELRTCTYRGPVSLCGSLDPSIHPGMYYLSLPRGALRPAHVVGSGAILRVARKCCAGAASSCCRRGYPRFRVPIESEQLPCWHSKDTFFWIELPPVPPQAVEDQLQILNEVF